MDFTAFEKNSYSLRHQYDAIEWQNTGGLNTETLRCAYDNLMMELADQPTPIIKARTLELILRKAPIAVTPEDIFQEKIFSDRILWQQRKKWENEIIDQHLRAEYEEMDRSWDYGAYRGVSDYGHCSPNSKLLMRIGLPGVLERVNQAAAREGLSEKQRIFYQSCVISLEALLTFLNRLADSIEPYNKMNAAALRNLALGAPANLYEAMQLLIVYFYVHEYVGAARIRTLGILDSLLYPFYVTDIENGTITKEQAKDLLRYFLNKFWAMKVPYDLPFALGGTDEDGSEITNELSCMIVETYDELDIYSPKIHIRVSNKSPKEFLKLVLRCIRGGNSSFVFVNDEVTIPALMAVGIEEKDARTYVPIGCYEPAAWGTEIGCTGSGGVSAAKAVELVFNNGIDNATGDLVGVRTGEIHTFDEFMDAIKKQIGFMIDRSCDYLVKIEKFYGHINPDPILSATYEHSVETGVDVYDGGAKYNNTSMCLYCIASAADAIAAVKRLVFDFKKVSFDELGQILRNNWKDHEKLRLLAKALPEKFGNNMEFVDRIAVQLADYAASQINNRPNARGGVFKASLFSIDYCFWLGEHTMATPDGRFAGEPLSKNLCAATAMDRNGITALINSVTKLDHRKFSNGSVLDIVLHPSAVSGEDGLDAFYGVLMTYMRKGGFAMHGNVFDSETLKKAQTNPEQYANLQVRVCGWNAYFVNLSKVEQDAFIKQAENVI